MPNPLKRDPTKTTLLRKQFMADMTRRFKALDKQIQELVLNDDAFGLNKSVPLQFNQQVPYQVWRFNTDANKVKEFKKWLKQQIDAGVLKPLGGISGKPWTAPYIESAYKRGAVHAYTSINAEELAQSKDFYQGGKEQFIKDAFNSPVATQRLELLYNRAFDELVGVSAAMSQQMGRILAGGLAHGHSAQKIAKALKDNITKLTKTRALVIARTEIIAAHAEGTLDAFVLLGVKEVGILAEWITAGDERVCPECDALDGVVLTIEEARGLIPRHPNCRCAWIPASKKKIESGQTRTKEAKKVAFKDSVRAEFGTDKKTGDFNKTFLEAKESSTWLGALIEKDLKGV